MPCCNQGVATLVLPPCSKQDCDKYSLRCRHCKRGHPKFSHPLPQMRPLTSSLARIEGHGWGPSRQDRGQSSWHRHREQGHERFPPHCRCRCRYNCNQGLWHYHRGQGNGRGPRHCQCRQGLGRYSWVVLATAVVDNGLGYLGQGPCPRSSAPFMVSSLWTRTRPRLTPSKG